MTKPRRTLKADTITMAHGAGGKAMRDLIEDLFVGSFDNPDLNALEDQARFDLASLQAQGEQLAFTTDSYVVDPLEFPGGDIGSLAVNGTVNDLAVSGAIPKYLSCGMILEEGLKVAQLRRIVESMRRAADDAGVVIVTGDTKVVPRGKGDKVFINTTGIGVIPEGVDISASRCQPGDKVIVNGFIGDHGAAILNARGDLALEVELASDCQPLHGLVQTMLAVCPDLHAVRDASRGGVATVLNEFAESSEVSIRLTERAIPVRDEVRGVCEILGLDALYFANEGKLVAVVPGDRAEAVLAAMRDHPAGRDAAIIGEVIDGYAGRVLVETGFGGERIMDMLVGEQLPRIC
ncbi:MAG: hydrogenase expression/formation protein HypE [Amphritea sp.]|nr:hydrogenase expression/formation protein HypE [Amphritea sp.]